MFKFFKQIKEKSIAWVNEADYTTLGGTIMGLMTVLGLGLVFYASNSEDSSQSEPINVVIDVEDVQE